MKRFILLISIAMFALFLILPACGGGGSGGGGNTLVGTWQMTSVDGDPVPPGVWIWTFNADGTGTLSIEGQSWPMLWSQPTAGTLTIIAQGNTVNFALAWISSTTIQIAGGGDVATFEKM